MKSIVVAAAVLMCASPLLAETYTWEDERGTTNFTDDYSNIPAKYRKKAQKLDGLAEEAPPSAPVRESSPAKPLADTKTAPEKGTLPAGDTTGLYGGRKGADWLQQMRPLYVEVKRLEQRLVELESLIRKPVGISKTRLEALPAEFKETQVQYNQALKQYNALNDEANKVGLPAEFRK